jgi:hypothetical protein
MQVRSKGIMPDQSKMKPLLKQRMISLVVLVKLVSASQFVIQKIWHLGTEL